MGGIIVIDFIDMERESDKEKVYQNFLEELKKDRAKTNVLKISELGLLQMTRKRTRESIERSLTEHCPFCLGRGRVNTQETEVFHLIRDLHHYALRHKGKKLGIKARPEIRHYLEHEEASLLKETIKNLKIKVQWSHSNLTSKILQEAPYEITPIE